MGAGCCDGVSPGVVGVAYNHGPGVVYDADDVALSVAQIPVLGAVVGKAEYLSIGVVEELECICTLGLLEYRGARKDVGGCHTADSLAGTDATVVVGIGG